MLTAMKPAPEIDSLDFRLLAVFDTVFEQRSLTKAARQLQISQPAVSQALARLRHWLDDPLFVRAAHGLEPTARAEQLAVPVRQMLALFREQVALPAHFDPATSEREFACTITDLGAIIMMPAIIKRFAQAAPGLRLRTVSIDSSEIAANLEAGKVDIAIGPFPKMRGGIYQQRLFEDEYVCLVRDKHPRSGRKFTAEMFRAAGHVLVSTSGTGHAFNAQVEMQITEHVPAENIRLRVHSFTVAAFLMRETDLVLTLPKRSGMLLAKEFGLKVLEPPLAFKRLEINQYWHERFRHDPGHQWFRGVVAELFNAGRAARAR
jgi:DNA-binding transcriptional LysR family regulator